VVKPSLESKIVRSGQSQCGEPHRTLESGFSCCFLSEDRGSCVSSIPHDSKPQEAHACLSRIDGDRTEVIVNLDGDNGDAKEKVKIVEG
jgi:hypothetical protein